MSTYFTEIVVPKEVGENETMRKKSTNKCQAELYQQFPPLIKIKYSIFSCLV